MRLENEEVALAYDHILPAHNEAKVDTDPYQELTHQLFVLKRELEETR